MREVRFARSARKHRIGRARVLHVLGTAVPTRYPATEDLDPRVEWIGEDDRGLELEVIAIELPAMWLVIHVMPTALRRNR